jgi:hypothetical protein
MNRLRHELTSACIGNSIAIYEGFPFGKPSFMTALPSIHAPEGAIHVQGQFT